MNGCSAPRYSVRTTPSGRSSWSTGQPAISSSMLRLSTMISSRITPGRGVDGADLVAAGERAGHVLGDVQDRAVRRQGVEVEDARQLHDPWLGSRASARRSRTGSTAGRLGAVGAVLDEHDGRAVGRHAGRHRIEPDRRQPPGALDRPHRAAEAGLDDEVLDEAVRALRGDRDEVTPGRVRDAERQLDSPPRRCWRA